MGTLPTMKGCDMNATQTMNATTSLASKLSKRQSERLTDAQHRLYEQLPATMDHVQNDSFELAATEEQLFGIDAPQVDVPQWLYYSEQGDLDNSGKKFRGLTHAQEQTLFLQYNYACYRTGLLLDAQHRRFSTARADELITWFQHVRRLRADLVNANLGLVLAMARRTKVPGVELSELVSEGNMALLRSIEKFDTSRGFKFSTYGCRAILKSFNRMATKTGRYFSRFPVEYDPDLEMGDNDEARHTAAEDAMIESLKDALRDNPAELTEVEQQVIVERFGLENDGKKMTLNEVGSHVGLTNERVRQVQNHGLRKLQRYLTPLL